MYTLVQGKLLFNPDILYTKNGNMICRFEIIDEDKKYKIVSSGATADVCSRYLKKGNKVMIKGIIENDFIIANSVDILG